MNYITHKVFVDLYNKGEVEVALNMNKAGDFVLSQYSEARYKLAHYFWTWLGILCIPAGIIFFFIFKWYIALVTIIAGLIVMKATRKSSGKFVLEQMLANEEFWNYVLLHEGATIKDNSGNDLYSEWLKEMDEKFKSAKET